MAMRKAWGVPSDSGIPRDQVFITTKLPAEVKNYDEALRRYEKSMANLGLGYTDLYLIHAPWPWAEKGADYTKENISVWKAMEKIYREGTCRSVGVSNFNVKDLTAILDSCSVKPMVNQIKFYIGFTEDDITEFCRRNDILVEGYSPLATGAILRNSAIAAVAEKYKRSIPQISVRYLLQKGVLPLPKSVTPSRIAENIDVDFVISADDMKYLDTLKDTVK